MAHAIGLSAAADTSGAAAAASGQQPGELLLRWVLEQGCSALFRSQHQGRILSNAALGREGEEAGGRGSIGATEVASALLLLESVPQQRQIIGDGFVPARYSCVQEIWGDE